jgi:hypothetical protein
MGSGMSDQVPWLQYCQDTLDQHRTGRYETRLQDGNMQISVGLKYHSFKSGTFYLMGGWNALVPASHRVYAPMPSKTLLVHEKPQVVTLRRSRMKRYGCTHRTILLLRFHHFCCNFADDGLIPVPTKRAVYCQNINVAQAAATEVYIMHNINNKHGVVVAGTLVGSDEFVAEFFQQ